MCLIGVPNLKEISLLEGCFGWLKVTFVKRCEEEEKCEENGAIFMNTYLINYWGMGRFLSNLVSKIVYCVYRGHTIHELDRNQPSGYRDTRG